MENYLGHWVLIWVCLLLTPPAQLSLANKAKADWVRVHLCTHLVVSVGKLKPPTIPLSLPFSLGAGVGLFPHS